MNDLTMQELFQMIGEQQVIIRRLNQTVSSLLLEKELAEQEAPKIKKTKNIKKTTE